MAIVKRPIRTHLLNSYRVEECLPKPASVLDKLRPSYCRTHSLMAGNMNSC